LKPFRRIKANVSIFGTSQLHLRNPYIIAWWSAAFPGFGHLLLSKYIRGFVLIMWEILINTKSQLNLSMVYSFTGEFEKAKEVLDYHWIYFYIPVYIFAIYDSYRTSIDLNKAYLLAQKENAPFNTFILHPLEINYLDKRNPLLALAWSLFIPGIGQLYIHRILSGFFSIFFFILFMYHSNFFESLYYIFQGDLQSSVDVIKIGWFLFLPSLYFFSIYDSYINAIENNKLFEEELSHFITTSYDHINVLSSIFSKRSKGMFIAATFLKNEFIELAIEALKEGGIQSQQIFSTSLSNKPFKHFFDSIHHSDGISYFDLGASLATASSVIGASIGYRLTWGPIIWGVIGAVIGFLLGFFSKWLWYKKKNMFNIPSQFLLIVKCAENESLKIKEILEHHFSTGVSVIDKK